MSTQNDHEDGEGSGVLWDEVRNIRKRIHDVLAPKITVLETHMDIVREEVSELKKVERNFSLKLIGILGAVVGLATALVQVLFKTLDK